MPEFLRLLRRRLGAPTDSWESADWGFLRRAGREDVAGFLLPERFRREPAPVAGVLLPRLPPRGRPVFFGMKTSSNPGTDSIFSVMPIIFSIAAIISPSSSVMKV